MHILKAEGSRLVDRQGRQVLLNGINLVCKDPETDYVTRCDESLFRWFASQGYNAVRLGLVWAAAEPEPGRYDDQYLARIREQVQWAECHGIYVFLDMHQDLYSVKFGGGAPLWATLDGGLPHATGDHWADAYLKSPAVNRAIDQFWGNAPAAGGIGLQDHYAAMWRHVAAYFKDCDNLIGYDIINEPYPGSSGQAVMAALISAYAAAVLKRPAAQEELAAMWFDDGQKQAVLDSLMDPSIYAQLVRAASGPSQAFEKDVLMPFYRKVAAAIAAEDRDRLLFLETCYFSNMGVESAIEPVQGMGCVYAPHGYDLMVDTEHYGRYSQARVDYIFEAHHRVQRRLNIPAVIGEWGAFSGNPATGRLSRSMVELFAQRLWGQTYWCWYEGYERTPAASALCRIYPQCTAGVLDSYGYDPQARAFEMTWYPARGSTRIFVPDADKLTREDILIRSDAPASIRIAIPEGAPKGIVEVAFPEGMDPDKPVVLEIRPKG